MVGHVRRRFGRIKSGPELGAIALLAAAAGLLTLLVVACGPGTTGSPTPTPAPTLSSGVEGIVLLGPTCPVQVAGASPCLTPYAALLVIVDSNGNKVASISSGPDGHFRVPLAPGDYVIQPASGQGGIPSGTPVAFSVVADTYVDVEVDYDSGIR
jgi:hypothetical protein